MPRVDFYVLEDTAPEARLRFACRLAEKAVEQGIKVFAYTPSSEAARRFDDLLWTYSDRSFLPHEIADATSPSHPRIVVLIGSDSAPPDYRGLLINLGATLPIDVEAHERIAEIVDADPEGKRLARERFKQYRERGCAIETHNV